MTDIECLAKLEAVMVENIALSNKVQLYEKLKDGWIAVKDPYEDLKKENEELKEQLEYLKQKLLDLYGIPRSLIDDDVNVDQFGYYKNYYSRRDE